MAMDCRLDWTGKIAKPWGWGLVRLWATHPLGGTLDVNTEGGTSFVMAFAQENK
jgi:hypothetical protein